jgi:hypothetical protein
MHVDYTATIPVPHPLVTRAVMPMIVVDLMVVAVAIVVEEGREAGDVTRWPEHGHETITHLDVADRLLARDWRQRDHFHLCSGRRSGCDEGCCG